MPDSFGARLRCERERRQVALKSIAEGTKISVALLEALERDDVSRWPSGIFRKSFVRSYAEAVGLDPEPIVREFVERYPDPLELDSVVPPVTRSSSSSSSWAGVPTPAPRPAQASLDSGPGRSEDTRGVATPTPPAGRGSGPLSVKLTITWSGSVHHTIGRLADWKIVRLLLKGRMSIDAVESANQQSSV